MALSYEKLLSIREEFGPLLEPLPTLVMSSDMRKKIISEVAKDSTDGPSHMFNSLLGMGIMEAPGMPEDEAFSFKHKEDAEAFVAMLRTIEITGGNPYAYAKKIAVALSNAKL